MTVQYYVASSLDGFIATADDSLDWLLQFGFDEFTPHYERFLAGVGALVMGSATYEFILGEGADAWSYGDTPTWVLTSRVLTTVPGANITFAEGGVEPIAAAAVDAAAGRNVWVIGGGDVAAQFADAGLIDELWVTVMPIVLGHGKPLLPHSGAPTRLELLETTPFSPSGATELRYRVSRP